MHIPLALVALALTGCAATSAAPARTLPSAPLAEDHHGAHHIGVFLGAGVENRVGHESETGFAFGLEYINRFHGKWGAGAALEGLGQDTVRNYLMVLPLSFYPTDGGWRVFGGPGIESTPDKDKFTFRLGTGYDFHLPGGWTLGPQVTLDLIETGENVYLGGVNLGYSW